MIADADTVTGWFVLNAGRVYGRCPACYSPRICYHKSRITGLKGISATSKGITPACLDCGKGLPLQIAKDNKPIPARRSKRKVTAS